MGCTPRRTCGSFYILTFAREHRDDRIHSDVLCALRHHDLGKRAVVDGLIFHRGFVGLDFGNDIARLDFVAFLLQPARQIALLHRGRQRRHEYIGGHRLAYR